MEVPYYYSNIIKYKREYSVEVAELTVNQLTSVSGGSDPSSRTLG